MEKTLKIDLTKIVIYSMLILGSLLMVISAFYASSFLVLFGIAVFFWGSILLYITPSKHVPLSLLNATTDLSDIERILAQVDFKEKGIYLPARNLKNVESSLVYIPEKTGKPLPKPEETNEKLLTKEENGLFLTPPGLLLSLLFEEILGYSFIKTDLMQLQNTFPKFLVETMEIAESVVTEIDGNTIKIEVTGSILDGVCQQTQNLTRTHEQIGCTLTSAIACALAKASGKPVTIQKEIKSLRTKVTQIEYRIEEE